MNMRNEPELNYPVFDMPEELPGARCRSVDPDAWFPEMGGNTRPVKAICQRCDERLRCLAGAVRREEHFGIWGGYSALQIRALYLSPVQGCEPPPARPGKVVAEEREPGRARRHLRAREFGLTRAS